MSVTTTTVQSVLGATLFVLAPLACSWDAPPLNCSWVEARRFIAPEGACTRYEVTNGEDSCVRRADSDDACTCSFELVVEPGTEVVYSYDYYDHDGEAGLTWYKVSCP